MPRPPLTKRIVDDAKPRAKRYLNFDGLVHGFALKVEVSGARVWVVQKSQAGRSIYVALGTYPDIAVDQTRRAAQVVVADLVLGTDPTADKRAASEFRRQGAADTLTVASPWKRNFSEGVVTHNKASTTNMKQRQWSSRVEPVIGRPAVRDITGQQRTEIVQGAPRTDSKGNITVGKAAAGNLYRLLHHMFAKALAWRLRPLELGHPLDEMKQPEVPRRERLLSDSELSALLAAVDEECGAPSRAWNEPGQVRLAAGPDDVWLPWAKSLSSGGDRRLGTRG